MANIVRAPVNIRTYDLLDKFVAILGTTKSSFWPLLEATGSVVRTYKNAVHYFTMTDAGAGGFYPVEHRAPGIHSYHFYKTDDQHGAGEDHADFEFCAGATDDAFSVGAWVWQEIADTEGVILAKYDTAGTDREWKFTINGENRVYLELYDESNDDTVSAEGTTEVTLNKWHFATATYGGEGGTPGMVGMTLVTYLDGVEDTTTIADGGGAVYADMEAGSTPLMFGAEDDTAAPANEFSGRIALPFICGKELTAANVSALYSLGKDLLGM